jgi:hypothetical protein
MPQFKTTYNILTSTDKDELWNQNWMDSDKVILPPKTDWDYKREMTVEDVDIWEVMSIGQGGVGVYAAWQPYAEFYLVITGFDTRNAPRIIDGVSVDSKKIETYYGQGAQRKVYKRAKELGIDLAVYKTWVPDDNAWIYSDPMPKANTFVFPNQEI